MNHLPVKSWYLTFITKVVGSHHTVLLRLGYNQILTCKSSFWCKEGEVGAVDGRCSDFSARGRGEALRPPGLEGAVLWKLGVERDELGNGSVT